MNTEQNQTHWESSDTNGDVARTIAVQVARELNRVQAEINSVQRLRRFACVALGDPNRYTDNDVKLELIDRLVGEVVHDMHSWLDAQVVALHDPCQTLDLRRKPPPLGG